MRKVKPASGSAKAVRELEVQIRRMRTDLRAAVELHEQQAEELRASNEELQVMNEELQVVNEELQRSRDDLESRVEERTRALASAIASLDSELRVRREAEDRVRALLRRLITVQEDERRRIARDLHDHLGQQSAALRLKLETIRNLGGGNGLPEALGATEAVLSMLDRDLDVFTRDLRPPLLDDLGVVVALGNFVREWSNNFAVSAEFHSRGLEDGRLPLETETGLYRIAQEALNNVHKHARATRVAVILERRGHEVRLVIEDNGTGFDRSSERTGTLDRGMGLVGMSERAALLGGKLEIETSAGHGTTIFVRIPAASGHWRSMPQ